jgi:exo-1,4-beta-D-glucosaminidase
VEAKTRTVDSPQERIVELELHNPSAALAFQISAAVRTETGDLVAPVLWSDNYIELMPGESRTLTAILPKNAPATPSILVTGWNIRSQTLHVEKSEPGLAHYTATGN